MIRDYEAICTRVCQAIRRSDRPQKYFYLSLGISRTTFHRRMRDERWQLDELAHLLRMVEEEKAPQAKEVNRIWKWLSFRRKRKGWEC